MLLQGRRVNLLSCFPSAPCCYLLNPCSRISISIYSGVARSGSSAICSRCCCSIAAFSCVVSCAIYLFFASRMLGGSFASFVLRSIRVEYILKKCARTASWFSSRHISRKPSRLPLLGLSASGFPVLLPAYNIHTG